MSRSRPAAPADARNSKDELIEEIESLRRRLGELERMEGGERKGSLDPLTDRLQQVYREAPIGLCYFDRNLRYVFINNFLAELNGISVEEHLGRSIREVLPDVAAGVEAQLRHVIETGEPIIGGEVDAETPAHPGLRKFFQHHYYAIKSETGTVSGVACVVQEVTERKHAEEEIRKLNEELEQRVEERTAELRAAQLELIRQERLATLGQLTAIVSHELRNPLGVIRTSVFIVREGLNGAPPQVQRSLERIERSVVRCDQIINELLDFTRISDLDPEPTPVDAWLEETLNEQALPTEITLLRDFGLGDMTVPFDKDRFRRAIINVFDNACQAMTGEGTEDAGTDECVLTVRTQERNGSVEVVFEDTGPGIPPDVYGKIFEPLFSTKGFGVGLGLPVVKQIMEQHNGGIEIETEEGRGTRVFLWLPHGHSTH